MDDGQNRGRSRARQRVGADAAGEPDEAIDGEDRELADRRLDWVISQEEAQRMQDAVDEAWTRYEQELASEHGDRRIWVAEADTDDDADY